MTSPLSSDRSRMVSPRKVRVVLLSPILLILASCSSDKKTPDTTVSAESTTALTIAPETTGVVGTEATPGTTATKPVATDATLAPETTVVTTATADTTADTTVAANTTADTTPAAVGANAIPRRKGEVGALKDATVGSCAKDGKNWVASGTLQNPTNANATYVIAVSFLDAKNATLGLSWTQIDGVQAGATKDWKVAASAIGDNLQCVLRVTRANV